MGYFRMGYFRRVVLIVLDSVGIGELPDAALYGDQGSDTLGNLNRVRPCRLPNLEPVASPEGSYGKAAFASQGKDSTTGHWELAGIIVETAFPIYPNGFPPEVIQAF